VLVAAAIFVTMGITGAVATSGTTNVAITPLNPTKTITSAHSITAGTTYAFVAAGGSSTVPSNARVVRLAVTVKGTKAGTLSFYPAGDPGSASPTTLSWAAGGSNAGNVNVNVGQLDKVTLTHTSAAAATVGVQITGFSTQVTSAAINGSGGTAGQVLTNNGDGTTAWKAAPGPTFLRAQITWSGANAPNSASLAPGGNAVSLSNSSVGYWQVTFGRSVVGCTFLGTNGTGGAGGTHLATIVTVLPGSGSAVTVYGYRTDSTGGVVEQNTSFRLLGVC
jgi:hypothetical protein